jgi:hypothetical protein
LLVATLLVSSVVAIPKKIVTNAKNIISDIYAAIIIFAIMAVLRPV